jgi:glutaredoxin
LLKRQGFTVIDQHLKNRDEVDALKILHDVSTVPQTFINEERIGGFDDLLQHFGKTKRAKEAVTYQPVIALFSIGFLLAVAIAWLEFGTALTGKTIEWFISISMVLLGLQKLMDIERFSSMFLTYDLLAQRWVRYSYIYPFVEVGAGLMMLMGVLTWVSAPAALFVASIGAVSVFNAVYINKRQLKCACVGGDSNVPLGFVSLTENLMMIGMAVWMVVKP